MGSGYYAGVLFRIFIVKFDVACFDSDAASMRHGISCIHCEIHKDLFKLSKVRDDQAKLFFQVERNRDVFTNHAFQH